jgi:D-arabinose 1-dehydrogenase-like Zn-dependent alcohol dehydrogenase
MPSAPAVIPAASLVLKRKSIMGSLIGGIAETQEMLIIVLSIISSQMWKSIWTILMKLTNV